MQDFLNLAFIKVKDLNTSSSSEDLKVKFDMKYGLLQEYEYKQRAVAV